MKSGSRAGLRSMRGFTLIEIFLALALTGFLMTLGAYLFIRPKAMVDTVSEQLSNASLLDIQLAKMVSRMSKSFPMRRGFISCEGDGAPILERQDPFGGEGGTGSDVELPNGLTLAYSALSVIAGLDTNTSQFAVPDASKFHEGAIVIVSSLNDPAFGAIYSVRTVDKASSKLTLNSGKPTFPGEFPCQAKVSRSLYDLINDPRGQVFNKSATAYRLEMVQLVRYEVKEEAGVRNLYENVWPVRGSNESVQSQIVAPGFIALKFEKPTWNPQGGIAGPAGNFFATLDVIRQERSLSSKEQVQRNVRKRVGYSTETGGQTNFGAVTAPGTEEASFPTCALSLSPASDMFARDDDRYAQMYRVFALISDVNLTGGLAITMIGPQGSEPTCWHETQLRKLGNRVVLPAAQGIKNSIAMNPGPTGIKPLICDIPRDSYFSAVLTYYHKQAKRMVRLPCGGAVTPSAEELEFVYKDGIKSECWSTGEIRFGTLVRKDSSPEERGPVLYVGGQSCDWKSSGKGYVDCVPNPKRGRLEKVRLLPADIPGGIPFAGGSGKNEIKCHGYYDDDDDDDDD